MSIRGLLIALVLLGALGGAVYWSERKTEADETAAAKGPNRLVETEAADVRRIEVHAREAEPVILERADDQWKMKAPENWRVDQSQAAGIAAAFTGLSFDRIVEEQAGSLADYGLDVASLTVQVTDKDGKTRKLLLGDETPAGSAVYAKFANEPKVFTVETSTRSTLAQSAQDLRDKRLLALDAEKVNRVSLSGKGQPVEFIRGGNRDWRITRPALVRADNFQVEELVRKLSETRMEVTDDDPRAASRLGGGVRVGSAVLADESGEHTIEVRKRGEEYFATSSATPGVFRIGRDSGEALSKGLDDFRNKKLFDFGFTEPSAVTVRDGEKTYSFVKGGDNKWWSNGKQMDATSVQGLLDRIRDLSAIRFLNSGFTTPFLEISVTSGEPKQVEKVLVSRTGNVFFARREGEPAIHELDSKAVEELQRAASDVKEPPPPQPAPASK